MKIALRSALVAVPAVAAVAAVAIPAGASANAGHRSWAATYPAASRLCVRADHNNLPKRLRADAAQLSSACTTLRTSFEQAATTVSTAEQTYRSDLANARLAFRQACRQERAAKPHAGCPLARAQRKTTLLSLRQTRSAAVLQFRTVVRSDRQAFWSTVRTLRAGSAASHH